MRVRKMTFLNVAKDASSLAFASLIQQCYCGKSLLLDGRKVNRNRKIFMVAGASSPLFGVFWLKIEPRSQFLFETMYEKKTKRYYLCYNVSGKFFKLSKIKR